uniref:Uncharacterized protein n=1 Tax=Myotis myotis TaxID=51298 RepID=A0A7J8ALF8_MYOMY|nr:hypothetical protein mMyoMyo1_007879 [Myotis myotis]
MLSKNQWKNILRRGLRKKERKGLSFCSSPNPISPHMTRHITKVKSQHIPTGQAHTVTQEDTIYTLRKLPQCSSMCHQKPGGRVGVHPKDVRTRRVECALGQAKFIEMSSLPEELSGQHVEEETQGLER